MKLNSFQVAWGTDLCGLISDHLALNQKCIIQKLTKCLKLLKMSKYFFSFSKNLHSEKGIVRLKGSCGLQTIRIETRGLFFFPSL